MARTAPFPFTATAACLVTLLAAPRLCTAGPEPMLEWDPATISPCIMWEDNGYGDSCEYVRDYWNITPEEFSEWNPSVGLDCKPWRYQSYCVVPEIRLSESISSTTTVKSTTTTTTTTTSSALDLGPSPTSWSARGCYVDEDPDVPVLEKRISKQGGDTALTIPKCQEACYRESFPFSGVKAGNECWCSSFIDGQLAENATAECNSPCSGDKSAICGGVNRLNVFEPTSFEGDEIEPEVSQSANGPEVSQDARSIGGDENNNQTSGATKIRALFLF